MDLYQLPSHSKELGILSCKLIVLWVQFKTHKLKWESYSCTSNVNISISGWCHVNNTIEPLRLRSVHFEFNLFILHSQIRNSQHFHLERHFSSLYSQKWVVEREFLPFEKILFLRRVYFIGLKFLPHGKNFLNTTKKARW